jgi:hypothetical protein
MKAYIFSKASVFVDPIVSIAIQDKKNICVSNLILMSFILDLFSILDGQPKLMGLKEILQVMLHYLFILIMFCTSKMLAAC